MPPPLPLAEFSGSLSNYIVASLSRSGACCISILAILCLFRTAFLVAAAFVVVVLVLVIFRKATKANPLTDLERIFSRLETSFFLLRSPHTRTHTLTLKIWHSGIREISSSWRNENIFFLFYFLCLKVLILILFPFKSVLIKYIYI